MLRNKIFGVYLCVGLGLSAQVLWSETKPKEELNLPIPELPVPERATEVPEDNPQTEANVLRFDESSMNPGFFTDTPQSKGFPRYFSALDISGYLRTRLSYFRNASLRTYIPELRRGTSNFLPNLSMLDASKESTEKNPDQNNFSGNMRLRLDPTINVSETVRVRSTVDVFDNMVLGSTPSYMYLNAPSPSAPVSLMSMSQNPPMTGVNSLTSAIQVKRAWGEANFPIGELRFGRMPFQWGLGILYNAGDDITNDYGDQIDGVLASTRLFDHHFTTGYSIAYTGPIARGGGHFSSAPNYPSFHVPSELGQRYPLEVGDLTHVFLLSMLKRENDLSMAKKRAEGDAIFEYGLLTSYRHQSLDSQNLNPNPLPLNTDQVVQRDGNVGLGSWWMSLNYQTFQIETEFAGLWGKYKVGHKAADRLGTTMRDIWLLQGGLAMQSKYGFLDDRLQLGLNAGLASSSDGAGFGIREGGNPNPQAGEADGRKDPATGSLKTNFRFNPAYSVDLLLFKEVLGGVSGSYYVKPHLSYFFSRNFGLRGDLISSFALNKQNTTGNSSLLGIELDGSAFLRTDDGFYFSMAYGVLFPLKGLNHRRSEISAQNYSTFGTAKMAQTLQFYFGLLF